MLATRKIQMVDLQGQFAGIREEVEQGIQEVLHTCQFINGPAVHDLSKNLADFLGVKDAIPCANGTDALLVALMALGLEPGDEVITVSHTFVATAEVIALLRLKPVFVDVYEDSFNMNVDQLEAAISEKTRCIIPVHLFGQAANMEAIMKIAKEHNLFVVEDNAQAIGAEVSFTGGSVTKTGGIGHIGCTSFYPSKNLGAYGDAGALFTNDEALAQNIRQIVNHGQKTKYTSECIGVNSRLDSFQAVVLNAKLKRLDQYNAARRNAADIYDSLFANQSGIKVPHRSDFSTHVFHQYTLVIEGNRDLLREKLTEEGIPSMVYYPVPIHLQPAYKAWGGADGDLPVTERLAYQGISLPMHTELTEEQQKHVASTLIECLTHC